MRRSTRDDAAPGVGRWSTRRAAFLWGGGVCFLAGSLAMGITGMASGSSPSSPSVVNQGSAGSQAWPVSATGTVGVNNFPSGFDVKNFPSTQAVSGTVGIDPNHDGVNVTNWPSTQNVSGSVGITGTPTVVSGDKTAEIFGDASVLSPNGDSLSGQFIDTSAYKTIRVSIGCDDASPNISWNVVGDGFITIAQGNLGSDAQVSQTFDVPGETTTVAVVNNDSQAHDCSIAVDGRAN